MVKVVILVILSLVLLAGLYVGGNILYGTITDFKPLPSESLQIENTGQASPSDSSFSLLIWNIGYSGLGQKEDFFYDGGKMVIAPRERVEENLAGIFTTLTRFKDVDFILLQEVDRQSRRSYYNDQVKAISSLLPNHNVAFAKNYSVKFVPMPLTVPPWKAMGKVESGLTSYSKYLPMETIRYSFPGNYSWPTRIYFLDRCFLLQRYALPGGKQLVVINTHNSAYDDGTLKAKQMQFLRDILIEEYEGRGNYVVVGGDWNQCPPDFDYQSFRKDLDNSYRQLNIQADYLPADWLWVYDASVATNRKLSERYDQGKTFVTLIDFFLVSPNLKVTEVRGIETNFQHSDHQPVFLQVELN